MSRDRECAQYVEGCHMTNVQSDFEGHSPTVIVIFIARPVYRLRTRSRVATLLTNHLRPIVSQNRTHPVVRITGSLPRRGPSQSRLSFVARLLCTHGKSRWDVPALEFTPAFSKHCRSLAYPCLHYNACEGRSPRRQTNRWFTVSGWVLRTTPAFW